MKDINLSQRPFCGCRKFPKCGIQGCSVAHRTEFHAEHMQKRERGQTGKFRQPNTQGGSVSSSVGGEKTLVATEAAKGDTKSKEKDDEDP